MPTDIYSLTIEPSGELSLTLSDQGVSIPANHAGTHASGSSDPITIANTQVTGLGTMSTQNAGTVAITGGTITDTDLIRPDMSDGSWEGGALTNATINGTVIGGTSAAAGTFTAVTGTTGTFSGAVSGTTGTFTGNTSVTGTLLVTGAVTFNTDLTVPNGGTGVSTITGIVKGNGASAMSAVTSSTVGQVLRCTGADAFAFGAVNLADTDAVTGALPVLNGGTGATTESAARTALDVPATNSTVRWRSDITAYNGGASNALDSIDISNTTTWPTGACIAFSVSGVFVAYRLTATGAGESSPDIIVPDTAYASREWTLVASGADAVVAITGGTITGITDLAVADGGTGASTLTGVVTGSGTSALTGVTSSTVGQVLRCTGANTVAFGAVNLADTDAITGTLPVGNGGTGATTLAGVQAAIGIVSGNGTLTGTTGVIVSVPGATTSSNIVAVPRAAGSGTSGIVYCVPGTDQITVTSTQATDTNAFTYFGTL